MSEWLDHVECVTCGGWGGPVAEWDDAAMVWVHADCATCGGFGWVRPTFVTAEFNGEGN